MPRKCLKFKFFNLLLSQLRINLNKCFREMFLCHFVVEMEDKKTNTLSPPCDRFPYSSWRILLHFVVGKVEKPYTLIPTFKRQMQAELCKLKDILVYTSNYRLERQYSENLSHKTNNINKYSQALIQQIFINHCIGTRNIFEKHIHQKTNIKSVFLSMHDLTL